MKKILVIIFIGLFIACNKSSNENIDTSQNINTPQEENMFEIIDIEEAYNKTGDKKKIDSFLTAVSKGDLQQVRKMIDEGIDVNARWWTGDSALWEAATRGQTEIVKLLIDAGADVNITNIVGEGNPPTRPGQDWVASKYKSSVLHETLRQAEKVDATIKYLKEHPEAKYPSEEIKNKEQQIKNLSEVVELLKAAGAKDIHIYKGTEKIMHDEPA